MSATSMSTIKQRAEALARQLHGGFGTAYLQCASEFERVLREEVRRERERCAVNLGERADEEFQLAAEHDASGRSDLARTCRGRGQALREAVGWLRSLPDEDCATAAPAPQEESMGDEIEKRARAFMEKRKAIGGWDTTADFGREEAARARREALLQAERACCDLARSKPNERSIALQCADAIRALSDSTAAAGSTDGRAASDEHGSAKPPSLVGSPVEQAAGINSGPAAASLTEQQVREIARAELRPLLENERESVEERIVAMAEMQGQFNNRLCAMEPRYSTLDKRIEALERHDTSDPRVLDAIQGHAKRIAEVERYIDERAPKVLTAPWNAALAPADSGKTGGEIDTLKHAAGLLRHYQEGDMLRHHDQEMFGRIATAVEALRSENAELARIAGEALGTDPEHRTAAGCVKALAVWNEGLRAENARLRGDREDTGAVRTLYRNVCVDLGWACYDNPSMQLMLDAIVRGTRQKAAPPAPEPLPVRFMEKLRAAALNNNFEHVERSMWAIPSDWRALLARVEQVK